MTTYIVLANFTEHGIRSVKETTRRAEAFKDLAKTFGISVKDIYWPLADTTSRSRRRMTLPSPRLG